MLQLLQAGTHDEGGTSRGIWSFINKDMCDVGGKTGTTSNYSDAWFVGCTPKLVGGAWVGGEYRSIHFQNGAYGQGARTALPVFGYFMSKVLADNSLRKYRARFGPPKYNIPESSYTIYTPADSNASRLPARPANTVTSDSANRPDGPKRKPDSGSKPNVNEQMNVREEDMNQSGAKPDIDSEFF